MTRPTAHTVFQGRVGDRNALGMAGARRSSVRPSPAKAALSRSRSARASPR
ncbi:hypothetical protein LZ189_09120 [Rhodovulum sulfidophilum]|nr:hypothetical protein [Rhodovulum sulfidophilum]